jgi:hypothetical protein
MEILLDRQHAAIKELA